MVVEVLLVVSEVVVLAALLLAETAAEKSNSCRKRGAETALLPILSGSFFFGVDVAADAVVVDAAAPSASVDAAPGDSVVDATAAAPEEEKVNGICVVPRSGLQAFGENWTIQLGRAV
jgi:hypothetical protein